MLIASAIFEKYSEPMDEADGPSILSMDPNERKLARKIRIDRRVSAKSKQVRTENVVSVELTPIEKQILDGISALDKLCSEGNEVVTGVRIANDARELERRKEVQETRKRLLAMLEEEDVKCMEKYREISAKWPDILACKDPLDIHDELEAQNSKCLEILEEKNAVIAELKQELENADIMYTEEVKKQSEDIDLLVERMEAQVRTMAKAYRQELMLIENVIESERKMLLATSTEKWEALFKKYREDTIEAREKKKEIMREYEEDMKKAMTQHQEEFRRLKISFELEIQNLQQEVQNIKALCLMNVEKLDYNYAVLKRREEENTIVKNQQKRKINKLQDVINGLKKTYTDLEESTRLEIQKLTSEILKSQKALVDLEKKSTTLANINDKKYMQIWDLNIKTANELVDKILSADKIIHEQLLGIEWEPPKMELLKKEDLTSYCGAMCTLKKEKEEAKKRRMISKTYDAATTLNELNLERRLLNHIVTLITSQCDYLIEDTLKDLLSKYTEEDNLLIRLDKIFQALKITSEEEFQFLLNFFLPYAHCPICTVKIVSTPNVCGRSEGATEPSSSEVTLPSTCGNIEMDPVEANLVSAVQDVLVCKKCHDDDEEAEEMALDSTLESSSDETSSAEEKIVSTCVAEGIVEVTNEDGEPKRQLMCDEGHLLAIETEFVMNALKEFTERYKFVKKQEQAVPIIDRVTKVKNTVSRNITDEDITEFWQRYRNVFSPEKERLWDNLLVGLKKYHAVLKERHQLNTEIKFFQKQNAELSRLLKSHSTESMALDFQLLRHSTHLSINVRSTLSMYHNR
ncbi:PREDICTED: dynein regulatory complex protein 1 [Dufourea novaeangliae]|uniref:dynein regulatory complex protein 1 n=1 Tax=Dufourea novaeangliae TaxID=178035 RepID=UPI0007670E3B|nr:PREDICTED: dynein regulatory complex protein 1 [Dufourea novaeangliae]